MKKGCILCLLISVISLPLIAQNIIYSNLKELLAQRPPSPRTRSRRCIEESNRCIIYREIIFYFTMFHSMIDFLLITLHPDNMGAGPASYGMTDTMGRMHSDAQFAGSSSVPAHVEMMGLIGMGNNPMVGRRSLMNPDIFLFYWMKKERLF